MEGRWREGGNDKKNPHLVIPYSRYSGKSSFRGGGGKN